MNEDEVKVINRLKQTIDFNSNLYIDDLGDNDIKTILNLINNQQKEIDEKSTIIMAGAEKVKQLEKGNRSLMESRIKWKNRYYKEKAKNKDKIVDLQTKLEIEKIDNKYNQEERDEETIPRYKIREKIKAFQDVKKEIIKNENKLLRASITYDIIRNDYCEKMLKELLEEN